MRFLLIFICVLVQLRLVNRDINDRYIQSNPLLNDIHSLNNKDKSGLSVLDTALVFVCFILSYITYLRHRTNSRLRQKVKEMAVRSQKGSTIIGGLQLFLEESRSKNSVIEMPLRKLTRNSEKLKAGITKDINDLNLLQSQFKEFRSDWLHQAKPYLNTSEEQLRANIDAVKVRTELAMLKDYIERELNSLKCVANYNKSLLDEALDDVDRLMESEGL